MTDSADTPKAATPAQGRKPRRETDPILQDVDQLDPAIRWSLNLRRDKRHGDVMATARNAGLILRNWEPLSGRIALNELTLEAEHEAETITEGGYFRWRERIEATWGVAFGKELFQEAIGAVAEEHAYHPVRDYLDHLSWDRQPRLDRVATEILDAGDDMLTIRMVRCWMIAAVARIYESGKAGSQVDTVLTLFSRKQGIKKTTFFRELAGPGWWTAGHIDPADKDTVLKAHQNWIVILDEVDEFTKRQEWPKLKRWIGEPVDVFRPPYASRPARHPRRFVFGATTNEEEFLDDPTGSRRWWILKIGNADPDARIRQLVAWRDQLWAEAVYAYRAWKEGDQRERWWLFPEEETRREQLASRYQKRSITTDRVEDYLDAKPVGFVLRMEDVLHHACRVPTERIAKEKGLERVVGEIMRGKDWERIQDGPDRHRAWKRMK